MSPSILGGTPCIAGTRRSVYAIAARVAGGETVADLIADYPYITAAAVGAAVEHAARVPFAEAPDGRLWRKPAARAAAE